MGARGTSWVPVCVQQFFTRCQKETIIQWYSSTNSKIISLSNLIDNFCTLQLPSVPYSGVQVTSKHILVNIWISYRHKIFSLPSSNSANLPRCSGSVRTETPSRPMSATWEPRRLQLIELISHNGKLVQSSVCKHGKHVKTILIQKGDFRVALAYKIIVIILL